MVRGTDQAHRSGALDDRGAGLGPSTASAPGVAALPPHSSWLNRVERFFRDITHPRIRRGGFNRVAELQGAINDYIAVHNAKPFI